MTDLPRLMTKNAKHWANNFAGIFLVAVTMFVIVIAVSRQYPHPGTATVLWLLGTLGICSLGCWSWLAHMAAGKSTENVLFKIR